MRNRSSYPAEWYDEIRPRILKRDNYRCTSCSVKHRQWVASKKHKEYIRIDKDEKADYELEGYKVYQILLHVCHQNHNKSDITDENLITKCVRCHARLDGSYKGLMRKTRRADNQINIFHIIDNLALPAPPLKRP